MYRTTILDAELKEIRLLEISHMDGAMILNLILGYEFVNWFRIQCSVGLL
jgi:hypothetical protein